MTTDLEITARSIDGSVSSIGAVISDIQSEGLKVVLDNVVLEDRLLMAVERIADAAVMYADAYRRDVDDCVACRGNDKIINTIERIVLRISSQLSKAGITNITEGNIVADILGALDSSADAVVSAITKVAGTNQ